MAAYAALLSLFHTLNHINIHPRPPISLDQSQVESLTQILTFIQLFLECYPTYEDEDLESRITAAAYAAEDVIESHILNQIHALSKTTTLDFPQGPWRVIDLIKKKGMKIKKKLKKIMGAYTVKNISSVDLYGCLEIVIKEMDLIQEKIMMMRAQDHPHLHTNSSVSTASTLQSTTMPVFDDAMIYKVLDKLTGQPTGLQIIPIVGMGGIGKTTFATNIYRNPLIVQYFDDRAWITISQEFSRRNILQLLCQEVKVRKNVSSDQMSEDEIGLVLYQHLCGRRYLIVMDDIWSIDAWDKVKSFFPNNNNGSRIMVTTRLSNLALELSGLHGFQMQFLDEDRSWDLLCEIVFGKLDCPIELENVGKEIAKKCRGLPLSICVTGGVLRKSNMKQTYWMYILENLSVIINLENDEYTLQILRTSYRELPMHLKPCFLYMGIFPEDKDIKTSEVIRLWVAEGILKPIDDKSLEEVAKEYLKELIDRNLILVSKLRWDGKAKLCKIHDLLGDVCLREARKQKFFCILRQQKDHTPKDIHMERRICINPETTVNKYSPEFLHAVEPESLTRSLLYWNRDDASPSLRFRLLRVYSSVREYKRFDTDSNDAIFEQANLRYLSLEFYSLDAATRMLSLFSLLWNLETLKVHSLRFINEPTFEIWKMPVLRHVILNGLSLPDPPCGEYTFVLENLETLSGIMNFKLSEEVVKRIPNIKKLKLTYDSAGLDEEDLPDFCLHNLGRLQKLESLSLTVYNCALEKVRRALVSFPHSLQKLSLYGTELSWEELMIRIGSLPLLQHLRLCSRACRGPKWETVEGQFCSLKVLHISYCDPKYWEMDSSHFPCLEYLLLFSIYNLDEIPSCVGDIPTLKIIRLVYCNRSVADSVKRIKDEQEENGNEDLRFLIDFDSDDEEGSQKEGEGELT